ncbi:MAG: hypothetical protein VSS75_029895 [Candidatus Parabeggiatoa sp.]|nr:hypothetical protein [Candidatus Parabeggiatoa sp.]
MLRVSNLGIVDLRREASRSGKIPVYLCFSTYKSQTLNCRFNISH